MFIKQAVFAGSSERISQKPKELHPEFAFIGRSNVGKSSLINCLCAKNNLAHTSSTPGKTLVVNHFLINNSWYLVDLPGYGYAKVGIKMRDRISTMINDYISNSQEMMLLFVLLDSRHPLQKIDLEFLCDLGEAGIPFSIIFTKCDKLGVNARAAQVESIKQSLLEYWEELPPCFVSSAEKGIGRDEILNYIEEILQSNSK